MVLGRRHPVALGLHNFLVPHMYADMYHGAVAQPMACTRLNLSGGVHMVIAVSHSLGGAEWGGCCMRQR